MSNDPKNSYIGKTTAHIERINDLIQQEIDWRAFAFLECSVYQFTMSGAESDFERDVLCYYQLIFEGAQYLWNNNPLTDYLKSQFNFDISNYRRRYPALNNLRDMRIFFSHHFVDHNTKYYDALCNYLNIPLMSSPDSIIVFDGKDKTQTFWNDKRNEMFIAVKNFLDGYENALTNRSNSEKDDFFNKWKDAVAAWYSKYDRGYLENLYIQWADDRYHAVYPPGFSTAPLNLIWNSSRGRERVNYRCFNTWFIQNNINDKALILEAIESDPDSFEAPEIFDYVFDKLFCDYVNINFEDFRSLF